MFKCFNRKFAISEQSPPPDVKQAFSEFSSGGTSMSADNLRRFLMEHQREPDCTVEDSIRIVENALQSRKRNQESNTTAGDRESGTGKGLSLDEFFQFLFVDDYNGPLKSQVCVPPFLHYLRKCGIDHENLFCFLLLTIGFSFIVKKKRI